MNMSRKHAAWAGAGLSLVLIAGAPAIADDTELLVSNPNSNGADKPNILFILDSSGSMTTLESTQEPYDPAISYSGTCDPNKLYWTRNSSPPDCSTNNNFDVASFVCEQGKLQMPIAGLYSDTMTQYRGNSNTRWRRLRRNNNGLVECQADSGSHGDGTAGEVFAQIGSNLPLFTSDPTREVDWGTNPTDRFYNVYSANYMNWFHNTPIVSLTRNEIVRAVTTNVVNSISNVNVGFMRFNTEQGGPVTHAVKDLDTNRSQALSEIASLPASGWTPLSETMYEAALYWRGLNAFYGGMGSTDSDALASTSPMVYQQPSNFACAKNFNVLLTDGAPTRDVDAYSRVSNFPNWTTQTGSSTCSGGNVNGACLDDIAEYLSKEDIMSAVPGDQTVTTYTIGFTVDLQLLKETAENSGGEYYLADDVASLTVALTDIVNNIFDRAVSFTAPAVSVNAFNRTQHLNALYISIFQAANTVHWPGNLKKYTINDGEIRDANDNPAVDANTGFFADNSLSYWTPAGNPDGADVNAGGAAINLPDPATRNVYTNKNGSNLSVASNHISQSNVGAFNLGDFGFLGAPGDPNVVQVIDWIRGVDVDDFDNDPATTIRQQMGDTLHSQPASIVYGGTVENPEIVVYAATNDGQLHAIDGATGQELWTFMPEELLGNVADLYVNDVVNYKQYGIDGDIVPIVADRNHDGVISAGTDFVYLVFGMRRGGMNYYALDVTNKTAPELKWIRSYPQFGQTWSPPVPARVQTSGAGASSPDNAVLVLGAGYDTTHDSASHPSTPDTEGAGIFMLDLETGAELWRAGADAGADLQSANMVRSIPSAIRVLDMSGDGFADRMYAADLGGQVWRFDIYNGTTPANLVTGGVIAQLGAEGTGAGPVDTRRFFAAPDVAMFEDPAHDRRYLSVSIGSGYRSHPLDKTAADRFYSIRDPEVFTKMSQISYDSYSIINDSDLVDVTGLVDVTLNPADRGWKFVLPAGEKVLSESRTFDGTVYFVSFEPDTASADPCQAGLSVNRLYRVSVLNGDPVVDLSTIDPNDPDEVDEARITHLEQGGIAPKPTFLFPSPLDPNCEGEACAPPPIGCVGVECFDPGFPNNPVRTLWTQDGIN